MSHECLENRRCELLTHILVGLSILDSGSNNQPSWKTKSKFGLPARVNDDNHFFLLYRKTVKPKMDLFSSPRAEVCVFNFSCCRCFGYRLHGHPHSNNFLLKQPRIMHFITLSKKKEILSVHLIAATHTKHMQVHNDGWWKVNYVLNPLNLTTENSHKVKFVFELKCSLNPFEKYLPYYFCIFLFLVSYFK